MISPNAYSGSLNSCQLPIYWGNDDSSHAKRPVDRAIDTIRLHSRRSELVSLAGGLLLNDLDCGKLSIRVWVGAWKTRTAPRRRIDFSCERPQLAWCLYRRA